jgi:hypothetical protein
MESALTKYFLGQRHNNNNDSVIYMYVYAEICARRRKGGL